MPRKILVLNSGSSSLKYRLIDLDGEAVLATGLVERIGEDGAPAADHRQAIAELVRRLEASGHWRGAGDLYGIGHRVVHGGENFAAAAWVDDAVVAAIRAAIALAPLHNPPNLLGIEVCRELWPGVPQVAVFDTAFHQTMPPPAYRYALPESCYGGVPIRRYGFHGTSFAYVTRRVAEYLGRVPDALNLIALHLGNGASACAIGGGRSLDTSMGLTPLAGLMMGTRCGDLDPGVVLYLLGQGRTLAEVADLLNRDSGLKGVAGGNDMRDVLARVAAGDAEAGLAVAMYCHRIKHYVGAYSAVLGRVDALVFTGGIGEHAAPIRQGVCAGLANLGIVLDEAANAALGPGIAELQGGGGVKILVVPADEELEIARQAGGVIAQATV
ncbi:acetate kinase [Methylomagnum ishizawai]|uniref:Acetate kinase n=1 Tax=Methylomagnum ishizawai TaxID=1760988 RepID=A0A1Y6D2M5_9GAMM|nr:acetate kinase [Methylomagnum ishizawai]SMF94235.1 acetate kinase [Methylomagnum ishizawai]